MSFLGICHLLLEPAVRDVRVSFADSMAFGNFGPHGHLPFHRCSVAGHMAQVEFGRVIDNRVEVLNRPVFGDRRLCQSGDVFEVWEEVRVAFHTLPIDANEFRDEVGDSPSPSPNQPREA